MRYVPSKPAPVIDWAAVGSTAAQFVATTFHRAVDATRNWDGFRIEAAQPNASSIFGVAEFFSTMALLLVVLTVSDFRYRYRLSVTRYDVRRVGIVTTGGIAGFLLLTEFWFQNSFPIPHCLNNYVNVKLFLATVFIVQIIFVVFSCFFRPSMLTRGNAVKFFDATAHYIHEGHKDRLQAIAEELGLSIDNAFRLAASVYEVPPPDKLPIQNAVAHDLLLTLADRRFCKLVVERNPSFAIRCFILADEYPSAPFKQFSRNIGEEFIINTESAFYQEDSGYYSGYFGYAKPITTVVFGSYDLIERCAMAGASPLDLHYTLEWSLNAKQMEGFVRAGLSFFQAYVSSDRLASHSYALARLLGSITDCARQIYILNTASSDIATPEYARFKGAFDFVKGAINVLAKSGIKARALKPSEEIYHDVYDALALTLRDLIFGASTVDVASFTCWNVQHNIAWNTLFAFENNYTYKVLRFKVRRLIYNKIVAHSGNFVGARYLGFCLNVCGLTVGNRRQESHPEEYALRICVISWTKKHYRELLEEHPKVALACLHGFVTYDKENHQLVQTFSDDTRKAPRLHFLKLD